MRFFVCACLCSLSRRSGEKIIPWAVIEHILHFGGSLLLVIRKLSFDLVVKLSREYVVLFTLHVGFLMKVFYAFIGVVGFFKYQCLSCHPGVFLTGDQRMLVN